MDIGRGGRIRTCDLSVPNRARYRAALRPVFLEKLTKRFYATAREVSNFIVLRFVFLFAARL